MELKYSMASCAGPWYIVILRQQHELVELMEDGATRLMDGEHNGTAVTGQSVERNQMINLLGLNFRLNKSHIHV